LQRAQDFARFVDLRCKIRLEEGHPRRRYTGVLKGLDPVDSAWLVLESDGQVHRLPLDAVERANLVLTLDEFLKLREVPDVGQ
jgi:ribosome maturation factor RimP